MASLVSRAAALLAGLPLVCGSVACGGRAAISHDRGTGSGQSGGAGTGNLPEPSSGAGSAGSPERDASADESAGSAGADSESGGAPPEAPPPSTACVQIRVPTAAEEPLRFRIVGTEASGAETGGWSVSGTCFQDSLRASVCYGDVPVGSSARSTNFKVQVQRPQTTAWLDLEIPLLIVQGNTARLERRVIWNGADMAAWLSGYHEETGSWCGASQPAPGTRWLSGTIDIGPLTELHVPPNTIRLGPPIAVGSTAVGANSVTDDPHFLAMWQRAISGNNDADSDGVPDDHDNCIGRAGTTPGDQSDLNHDGLGDTCENVCYVPSSDPNATYFDYDGDGIDDACDDDYIHFNPAQYPLP